MNETTSTQFSRTLRQVSLLWRSNIDRRLKPYGVSQVQWLTLYYISKSGKEMLQKMLAEKMAIEGATMVGILDRLVTAGFVERHECSHDRRGKTIHLLPAGHQLLEETTAIVQSLRDEVLDQIDDKELETCLTTLDKIYIKLNEIS